MAYHPKKDRWPVSARIGCYTGPREPSGCRIWTGATLSSGYPVLQVDGRAEKVTRLILGLRRGDGLVAMHSCDTPSCVEPSHLSAGSVRDNAMDASRKGRLNFGDRNPVRRNPGCRVVARGEGVGGARLTESAVREIRRAYLAGEATQDQLAARFGVTQGAVWMALKRKTWAHVS